MNADGSGQTRLTKDQAEALQPRGHRTRQIAFTRSGDSVWVIDADGGNLKSLITKGGAAPGRPTERRSSTQIAIPKKPEPGLRNL